MSKALAPGSAAWAANWGRRLRLRLLRQLHADLQLVLHIERPRVGGMSVSPCGRRQTTAMMTAMLWISWILRILWICAQFLF